MKKFKNALIFTLSVLPIAGVAAYFTILYQMEFMDAATLEIALEQIGGKTALIVVYIVQILVYAAFCGFVGHILAEKLGLMKPIRFEKRELLHTLVLSLVAGVVLALDYWTFGAWIPGVREADEAMLSWNVIASCVLYGGVMEELMMRLFLMSLLAWLCWKLFLRKRETVPTGVVIAANVITALLFAAGHLPATFQMFGTLTPLILFRCFLLNGGFGLVFGWLYRKYGIQYSMLSHALTHIVSKTIWLILI